LFCQSRDAKFVRVVVRAVRALLLRYQLKVVAKDVKVVVRVVWPLFCQSRVAKVVARDVKALLLLYLLRVVKVVARVVM